jgi:cobalt/nickel transport system permease protein
MHIPDGFLSVPVWAGLQAVSAPAVALLTRRARQAAVETRAPLLGVMGAFVFAAQMVNFPVAAGASGHLVGAALLAAVLRPAAAAVVMTAILAIQALIFQDGGLLALGANVANMALAGVLAAALPLRLWRGRRGRRVAIFLAGFCSVMVAAALALGELLVSGVRIPAPLLWTALGVFTVTAAVEGVLTLFVLEAIERIEPAWLRPAEMGPGRALPAILLAAVLLAAAGFLAASALPDGLERLIGQTGLGELPSSWYKAPLAEYELPAGSAWLRKSAAGLLGFAVALALCTWAGRWLSRRRSA